MRAPPDGRALLIAERALELDGASRGPYLSTACGDDNHLRQEVEALIRSDAVSWHGLDVPALGAAFHVSAASESTAVIAQFSKVGPYTIEGVLGVGAMGVVYRARQETPQRVVALKIVRMAAGGGAKLRRRLQHEAEILARLRHPGIAQIYDAATVATDAGPLPYIAMEPVEGSSLIEFANAAGLALRARIELVIQVCDAIAYAHQRGVIHRDLKPANIMVEGGDQGPRVRVLDFGIARLIGPEHDAITNLTEPGQLIGTIAYMSPEQLEGRSDEVDTRTDVYSVGVLLYQLIAGRLPIESSSTSVLRAVQEHRELRPTPIWARLPSVASDLATIIGKSLERDLSQRYQAVADLAADLRRYLAGEPILARPPSLLYTMRKFAQRNRSLVASLCVVSLASALGVAGTGYGYVKERAAAREARLRSEEMAETASFLTREVVRNLDNVAGTAGVRRALVERLRPKTEWMLQQHGADTPELLAAHAEVLTQLGIVKRDGGDREGALKDRLAALTLRRQLLELDPQNIENVQAHAISLVHVGDVHKELGNHVEAWGYYERACLAELELARREPDAPRVRTNLGWSLCRLADLAQCAMDPGGEPEAMLLLACHVFTAALERDPANLQALDGMSTAYSLLAERRVAQEDYPAVAGYLGSQRAFIEALLLREPENRIYLRAAAYADRRLAQIKMRLLDLEGADELCQAAQRRAARITENDPQDRTGRCLMAEVRGLNGELALLRGDAARALQDFEESIALFHAASDGESTIDVYPGLEMALRNAAVAELERGDFERATAYAKRRRDYRQQFGAWLRKLTVRRLETVPTLPREGIESLLAGMEGGDAPRSAPLPPARLRPATPLVVVGESGPAWFGPQAVTPDAEGREICSDVESAWRDLRARRAAFSERGEREGG